MLCSFSCFLHSVANSLKTMQHTVVKRFIHCKHNITLWNTQAFWQKSVTFFAEVESWSRLALFVWDWNCRARRIASNFTRFYRIAKVVTRRIWLDLCPKPRHRLTSWHRKRSRNLCSSNLWFRRNMKPPIDIPYTHYLHPIFNHCNQHMVSYRSQ